MKRKWLKTATEGLKQRMLAKSAKVRRYQQRIEQFRQNRIFDFDQKKVERVVINVEKAKKQRKMVPNWKSPGKDDLEGYQIKTFSNLHEQIAVQTKKILMEDDSLPAWMTHGRTVLFQKDPRKVNAVENYCPITCLSLMWKLLKGWIAEEMHDYLEQEKLLP